MRRGRRGLIAALALLLSTSPLAVAGEAEGSVTATVRISGVTVVLEMAAASITVGQAVKAEAFVTNLGADTVRRVTVELRFDESGLSVRGGTSKSISNLRAGVTSSVSWNICGRSPGAYLVLVTATADDIAIDSEARLLVVNPGGRRPC
jgi:uncharacterized membrane protein